MQQKKYKWGFSSPSTASLETVANMVDNKQVSHSNQNPTLCLSLLSRSLSVSVRHPTLCVSVYYPVLYLYRSGIPLSVCLKLLSDNHSSSLQCPYFSRSLPVLYSAFHKQGSSRSHRLAQSHSLLIFPALFPFQIVPFIHKVLPALIVSHSHSLLIFPALFPF